MILTTKTKPTIIPSPLLLLPFSGTNPQHYQHPHSNPPAFSKPKSQPPPITCKTPVLTTTSHRDPTNLVMQTAGSNRSMKIQTTTERSCNKNTYLPTYRLHPIIFTAEVKVFGYGTYGSTRLLFLLVYLNQVVFTFRFSALDMDQSLKWGFT